MIRFGKLAERLVKTEEKAPKKEEAKDNCSYMPIV
jgi:hypothetical protein